jgi:hypothetical protein
LRKGDAVTVGEPAGAAAGGATPCRVSGENTDFFSRHAGRDTAWAEWLAWQLQQAGYGVELDVWDWAPGEDFVARMQAALESADRVLAVCTEAYFASVYGGAELRAAFVRQAKDVGRIVPVLVEPVTLPPLYAPLIRLDLTGLDEAAAAARLRARLPRAARSSLRRSPAGLQRRVTGRAIGRGSPVLCRRCGRFRRAIPGSPAGTACSPRCGDGCTPGRPR